MTMPPANQTSCAHCASNKHKLRPVRADNGRTYLLCKGCENNLCAYPGGGRGPARIPQESFGGTAPQKSRATFAKRPTADEQLPGKFTVSTKSDRTPTFAEELEALRRKWSSR